MRFKFDPEYASGAIVLAVLTAVIAVAVYFVGGSEIRFWQHSHYDGWTGRHLRALFIFVGLVLGAVGWIWSALKGGKERD